MSPSAPPAPKRAALARHDLPNPATKFKLTQSGGDQWQKKGGVETDIQAQSSSLRSLFVLVQAHSATEFGGMSQRGARAEEVNVQ